jgi:signal transduction histidine kinase
VNEDGRVTCSVGDDGAGISEQIAEFRPDSIGMGISGMRQRVKELGGTLQLRNTGSGSLLVAIIPIVSRVISQPLPRHKSQEGPDAYSAADTGRVE